MRILLTGATGFVGGNLLKKLKASKNSIRVLVRDKTKIKATGVKVIQGDLLDQQSLLEATKGVHTVIHCAASLGGFHTNNTEIYKVNITGTELLFNAATKNKVKRFILISSVAAMGSIKGIADESTPCRPKPGYEWSKYRAEEVVKAGKIKYIIIRPSMVYGPGEVKNKAKWFKIIQEGKYVIIGKGDNYMSFVYIDDLINGIMKSLNSKKNNQTYILTGQNIRHKDFVSLVAHELGVKSPRKVPYLIALTGSYVLFILGKILRKTPPLFPKRVRSLTNSIQYSTEKAKKDLKYEPKVEMKQGITLMIKWLRKEGLLK